MPRYLSTSVFCATLLFAISGCIGPGSNQLASSQTIHSSFRLKTNSNKAQGNDHPTVLPPQHNGSPLNETATASDHYRYPMPVSGQQKIGGPVATVGTTQSLVSSDPAVNLGVASAPVRSASSTTLKGSSSTHAQPVNSLPLAGSQHLSTVYETSGGYVPATGFQGVIRAQFTDALPPPPSSLGNDTGNLPPPPDVLLEQSKNQPGNVLGVPSRLTDVIVNVQEAQTGRLMIGAGINSDAGVIGQIVVDEKNFDWRRFPRSFADVANGTAWRGAGQGFRVEALPGRIVQRYMVQFTEPYLFDTRISFNISGYLFDRRYFDWDEQRLGGRLGLGYRLSPDLSVNTSVRAEEVKIRNIRAPGEAPQLDAVAGNNDVYSGRVALVHDTRDIPFAPTQGHYLEFAFEQVFGSFDYSRGSIDARRYFLITERPDGSGRHTLGFSNKVGISGNQTPIFENYFAGGYSTLRGFDFRDASPLSGTIRVGGRLQLLGSVEYLFPITADDMLKGVVFCDYGTIEEDVKIESDDYRIALGTGLRITVPAMGPAPIALDFAVPVAKETGDESRTFSFYMGIAR